MLCNEFDSSLKALVNPEEQFRPIPGFPEICVMAFSAHIVEKCLERYGGEQIADVPFCTGRVPIYRVVIDGTEVALSMPHVGGPAASAFIEEVWPRGGKYFVFFGAAGVLDRNIPLNSFIAKPGPPTPSTGRPGARWSAARPKAACPWRWSAPPWRQWPSSGGCGLPSSSTPRTTWTAPCGTAACSTRRARLSQRSASPPPWKQAAGCGRCNNQRRSLPWQKSPPFTTTL